MAETVENPKVGPGVGLKVAPKIDPKPSFHPLMEVTVRLRTNVAWKVPVIYGRHPAVPDESASASEKGAYALFVDVAVPTSQTR